MKSLFGLSESQFQVSGWKDLTGPARIRCLICPLNCGKGQGSVIVAGRAQPCVSTIGKMGKSSLNVSTIANLISILRNPPLQIWSLPFVSSFSSLLLKQTFQETNRIHCKFSLIMSCEENGEFLLKIYIFSYSMDNLHHRKLYLRKRKSSYVSAGSWLATNQRHDILLFLHSTSISWGHPLITIKRKGQNPVQTQKWLNTFLSWLTWVTDACLPIIALDLCFSWFLNNWYPTVESLPALSDNI